MALIKFPRPRLKKKLHPELDLAGSVNRGRMRLSDVRHQLATPIEDGQSLILEIGIVQNMGIPGL
jgi:hypothetical protein